MGVGNRLKKARKSRGLSLDDIKNKSKIKKSYLEALENENFEKLPGEVYTKVYIRGYAKIVGIDPQKLLSEFENSKIDKGNSTKNSQKVDSKDTNNKIENFLNKDKIFRVILGVILILIIVLLSYNIFFRTSQNQNNNANNDQTAEVVQQESSGNSNAEELSEEELESDSNHNNESENNAENIDESDTGSTEDEVNQNNEQDQKPLMEDKSKEIKIIASDKSWLQVNVDGELKFQGFINEDETMSHTGNETIRLKIGNGIAIEVEFEGEKLGPFGNRGEVIVKEFDI